MEIENIQKLDNATSFGRKEMFRIGSTLLFIVGIMAALLFFTIRGMMLPYTQIA